MFSRVCFPVSSISKRLKPMILFTGEIRSFPCIEG